MLDSDNFCRIEKELGKDRKPNICNLFPFNSLARIGKTIVVSPHFLCPLRAVVPARPGEVEGTHALIDAAIRKSQILDEGYIKFSVPSVQLHPMVSEDTALSVERGFRDLCSDALGKRTFRDTLMGASTDGRGLQAFIARAMQIMGLEPAKRSKTCDYLDDLLLAFAPPHRLSLLSLESEGILRALSVAEIIVRRAWSDATKQPTLQGIANTVATFRDAQVLLAQNDERFDFGKINKKTFSFNEPELTFAAFVAVSNANGPAGVMGALEQAILPSMSVSDRSVLLLRLGHQLEIVNSKQKRKHARVIEKILSLHDRPTPEPKFASAAR